MIPDIKERMDQENTWNEIEGWEDLPIEKKEEIKETILNNTWQDLAASCYSEYNKGLFNWHMLIFLIGTIFYISGIIIFCYYVINFINEYY